MKPSKEEVKIICHTCEGRKWIPEREYPDGREVKVVCPECDAEGYVEDEIWEEPQTIEVK